MQVLPEKIEIIKPSWPRTDLQCRKLRDRKNPSKFQDLCKSMPVIRYGARPSVQWQKPFGYRVISQIETTGFYGARPVEIAAIGINLTLEPVSLFYSLMNPGERTSFGAFRENGWNNNKLCMAPSPEKVFNEFRPFIGKATVIGWHPLQRSLISRFMGPVNFIDLQDISREIIGVGNISLVDAVNKMTGLKVGKLNTPIDKIKADYLIYLYAYKNHRKVLDRYLSQDQMRTTALPSVAASTVKPAESGYRGLNYTGRKHIDFKSTIYSRFISIFKYLVIASMDTIINSQTSEQQTPLGRAKAYIESLPAFSEKRSGEILSQFFAGDPYRMQKVDNVLKKARETSDFKRALKWAVYYPELSHYFSASYRQKLIDNNCKEELIKASAKLGTLNNLLNKLMMGDPKGFVESFDNLFKKDKKYAKEMRRDRDIRSIAEFLKQGDEFFKDLRLIETVKFCSYRLPDENVLVITENRDRAVLIDGELKRKEIPHEILWGLGKSKGRKGITQKERQRILSDFTVGKNKVLIATRDLFETGNIELEKPLSADLLLLDYLHKTVSEDTEKLADKVISKGGAYYDFKQED